MKFKVGDKIKRRDIWEDRFFGHGMITYVDEKCFWVKWNNVSYNLDYPKYHEDFFALANHQGHSRTEIFKNE